MSMVLKTTTQSSDAADYVAFSIFKELKAGKHVLMFVSGGSAISIAVQVADILRDHPHQSLTVMQTDERYGPVDHPDSNFFELTKKGFNLPQAKIIPVLNGENSSATTKKFIDNLNRELKFTDYKMGLFGIGADGHTAGILPDSPAITSKELACYYETPTFSRITMTSVAIEKLDEAVIWAQGKNKWPVLEGLESDIPISKQPMQILKKVPLLTVFSDFKNN